MTELIPVSLEQKETLRNLMEKYLCEFAQYDLHDVGDDGLYHYRWLDCYWTEPNRFAYFIRVDEKLAGFAMVNDYPEIPDRKPDFCLAEFFVLPRYRRMGAGREAAFKVFDLHRGKWQFQRHPHNLASVHFWNRVVDEYTRGQYELIEGYPNPEVNYDDGTPADVFFFDNSL